MPKHWYNIQADLPTPAPPVLHPGTLQPVGPDDLAPLAVQATRRVREWLSLKLWMWTGA